MRCRLKKRDFPMVDLTIAVPTEEAASAVCMNWKDKSQDIYENLIELLLWLRPIWAALPVKVLYRGNGDLQKALLFPAPPLFSRLS